MSNSRKSGDDNGGRRHEPNVFGGPKAEKPKRSDSIAPRRSVAGGDSRRVVYQKESGRAGGGKKAGGRSGGGNGGGSGFWGWLKSRLTQGKLWMRLLSFGLTLGVVGLLLLIPFFLSLPDISKLMETNKKPSIIVVTEDNEPIGQFGDVMGEAVPYDKLPKTTVDALVATEDRRFFDHWGVDPWGILRAVVVNARAGHVVQGGSTLTQQLAKNVFLTPDRTLKRKIQEALLALKLEGNFSKQEILSIYLNRVYLGGGNFGIEAAAQRYFGKHATELNVAESAVIVGLLKAPSRYSPLNNPDLARKRGEQVLVNMHDADLLDDKELANSKKQLKTVFAAHQNRWVRAPYFADWIADELTDYIGGLQQDVIVTTTLDTRMQKLADEAVVKVMAEMGADVHASQASLVAMTPQGAVRAMVGGVDYNKSQFNRATQALRQPGSSFKLFVYLAGMEGGYLPDSMLVDEPVSIKVPGRTWSPGNHNGKYIGPVSLRTAFAESLNTVAVRLSESVGRQRVANMATRLGVHLNGIVTPAIALGVIDTTLFDMTTAYAHLASGGRAVVPYGIVRIELARPAPGQDKLLYMREGSGFGQALSFTTVAKMNTLTRAVVTSGTGGRANIGRPVAGKTGTSQDYRDAWFIGYVPQLTTGVWVGNDNNSAMKKSTGGNLPARIFAEFMKPAVEKLPPMDIPEYSGSSFDGLLPWQTAPATPEDGQNFQSPSQNGETQGLVPMQGEAPPAEAQPQYQQAPGEGVPMPVAPAAAPAAAPETQAPVHAVDPSPQTEAPRPTQDSDGAQLDQKFWDTLLKPEDGQPATAQ